jgi:hypothetical protein
MIVSIYFNISDLILIYLKKNSGLNIEIGNSMAFGNFLGPRGQYWLRSVLSNANYRIAPAIVRQLFEMWHQNGSKFLL